MNILGVYDGHNANVALVSEGRVVASLEEERLSRQKNHDGRVLAGPVGALRYCLAVAGQVDAVALALEEPSSLSRSAYTTFLEGAKRAGHEPRLEFLTRTNPRVLQKYPGMSSATLPALPGISQQYRVTKIRDMLGEFGLESVPVCYVNHHHAHAASSYYTSGRSAGLCLSLDGKGDDLAGLVALADDGVVRELARVNFIDSVGHFYQAVTAALGFRPLRHEGKITGLAAYAQPEPALCRRFRDLFELGDDGVLRSNLAAGLAIGPYPHTDFGAYVDRVKALFGGADRATVAACAQHVLEDVVGAWAQHWVTRTGRSALFLAGGVFANVRLNQRILELDGVEFVSVHPAMSDAGLGAGAALSAYHRYREAAGEPFAPVELDNVYWGPEYPEPVMEQALRGANLSYTRPADLSHRVALAVAEGKIVARFEGRLEYGPRALGHRSILYHTRDPSMNRWLNEKLGRTEFMPFAPATLFEAAERCYKIPPGKDPREAARFMTVTLECTDWMKATCPAVVHVDGTARPQLVRRQDSPAFYEVIEHYHALTQIPCIVNTSFNLHEEPIVCTPEEAIRAYLQSGLDVLALGPFLVEN